MPSPSTRATARPKLDGGPATPPARIRPSGWITTEVPCASVWPRVNDAVPSPAKSGSSAPAVVNRATTIELAVWVDSKPTATTRPWPSKAASSRVSNEPEKSSSATPSPANEVSSARARVQTGDDGLEREQAPEPGADHDHAPVGRHADAPRERHTGQQRLAVGPERRVRHAPGVVAEREDAFWPLLADQRQHDPPLAVDVQAGQPAPPLGHSHPPASAEAGVERTVRRQAQEHRGLGRLAVGPVGGDHDAPRRKHGQVGRLVRAAQVHRQHAAGAERGVERAGGREAVDGRVAAARSGHQQAPVGKRHDRAGALRRRVGERDLAGGAEGGVEGAGLGGGPAGEPDEPGGEKGGGGLEAHWGGAGQSTQRTPSPGSRLEQSHQMRKPPRDRLDHAAASALADGRRQRGTGSELAGRVG